MQLLRIIQLSRIIFCLFAVSTFVRASPIQQVVVDNYGQINHFGPIGQSFVAEDNYITADFWISEYNQHIAPSDYDISYYLYEGTGAGGTLISSGIFSGLSDGYLGWIVLDLSTSRVTIGDTYSLMVNNENARWGFGFSESDLYAGGRLILSQDSNSIFPSSPLYDAAFRINPASVVPEPSSIALILLGIAGMGVMSKRNLKHKQWKI